jgi:hypothetical protein
MRMKEKKEKLIKTLDVLIKKHHVYASDVKVIYRREENCKLLRYQKVSKMFQIFFDVQNVQ